LHPSVPLAAFQVGDLASELGRYVWIVCNMKGYVERQLLAALRHRQSSGGRAIGARERQVF